MGPLALLGLAAQHAKWLSVRQTAVSQNLANANTPGYRRRDVDFHGALQQAMQRDGDAHRASFAVVEDVSTPTRADGSSVSVDAESAALARNALEQQALATIVKARTSIVQSAIGH